MKKATLLTLILIVALLAVSVVPAMAKDGPVKSNGQIGNGNQGGHQDQDKNQDRSHDGDDDQDDDGDDDQDDDRDDDQDDDGDDDQDRNQDKNRDRDQERNQNRMRTPFYLQGTISAIDAGTRTVTVTLFHGNSQVKAYLGTDLALSAPEGTLIFQVTQGDGNGSDSGKVAITFDQLAVGQKVAIHGNVIDSSFIARLITVYI